MSSSSVNRQRDCLIRSRKILTIQSLRVRPVIFYESYEGSFLFLLYFYTKIHGRGFWCNFWGYITRRVFILIELVEEGSEATDENEGLVAKHKKEHHEREAEGNKKPPPRVGAVDEANGVERGDGEKESAKEDAFC